jgi:hypothetical protein
LLRSGASRRASIAPTPIGSYAQHVPVTYASASPLAGEAAKITDQVPLARADLHHADDATATPHHTDGLHTVHEFGRTLRDC